MIVTSRHIRHATIAALLAPLVFAGAVRLVEPAPLPGPSAATAQPGETESDPESLKRAKSTPAQKEAVVYLEGRAAAPPAPNVFAYPRASEQRADRTADPRTDPSESIPDFEISSIMRMRDGQVALINGRLRRVGNEAAPGWIVKSIDDIARTVTLAAPDGRTHTITMPTRLGR